MGDTQATASTSSQVRLSRSMRKTHSGPESDSTRVSGESACPGSRSASSVTRRIVHR